MPQVVKAEVFNACGVTRPNEFHQQLLRCGLWKQYASVLLPLAFAKSHGVHYLKYKLVDKHRAVFPILSESKSHAMSIQIDI